MLTEESAGARLAWSAATQSWWSWPKGSSMNITYACTCCLCNIWFNYKWYQIITHNVYFLVSKWWQCACGQVQFAWSARRQGLELGCWGWRKLFRRWQCKNEQLLSNLCPVMISESCHCFDHEGSVRRTRLVQKNDEALLLHFLTGGFKNNLEMNRDIVDGDIEVIRGLVAECQPTCFLLINGGRPCRWPPAMWRSRTGASPRHQASIGETHRA